MAETTVLKHGNDHSCMRIDRGMRRNLMAACGLVLLALIVYRTYRPVPGATTIMALLLGATLLLWILREISTPEELRDITARRPVLEGYRAEALGMITGLMVFVLTLLATYMAMALVAARQQSGIPAHILFELLQRIRLFELFDVIVFTGIFAVIVTAVIAGVLLIYPVIPIQNQRLAMTTSFLLSSTYTFSAVYLLVPIIHPLTVEMLIIDLVLVVIWANLFHQLYEEP